MPGDVIGSGTVGTGCFLELNGTGRRLDPEGYQTRWLAAGDIMELEISGLGVLTNTVVADEDAFSILALKKVSL
jgi:fumarylacetoacetate (FAA) hydrolase